MRWPQQQCGTGSNVGQARFRDCSASSSFGSLSTRSPRSPMWGLLRADLIRTKVIPETLLHLARICQAVGLTLRHQTLSLAFLRHHDHLHFSVNMAFAIPVAAGGANLDLSRQYEFLCHSTPRTGFP